ncbi:MAG: type IV pilus biogenesis/stability protein PilW [Pseudomonadota bacterium]
MKLSVLLLISCFLGACASTGVNSSRAAADESDRPDKALIHAQLAKGYLQQKQYAVAKTELEKALRINPAHSDSNYVMALLMMELEQYDTAEKHFSKAVKADQENSAAAHDFGMLLCQTGRERQSVRYFEIAASNPLFEKSELSFMRAGECLARINDPIAEDYLKRALAKNPRLRPALYRLAVIKHDAQSYFSARAYLERYLAITKPQPESLLLAYKIESKLNATDVANDYRTTLLEEFPGSEQASELRRKQRTP